MIIILQITRVHIVTFIIIIRNDKFCTAISIRTPYVKMVHEKKC